MNNSFKLLICLTILKQPLSSFSLDSLAQYIGSDYTNLEKKPFLGNITSLEMRYDNSGRRSICTATIISKKSAFTALHCMSPMDHGFTHQQVLNKVGLKLWFIDYGTRANPREIANSINLPHVALEGSEFAKQNQQQLDAIISASGLMNYTIASSFYSKSKHWQDGNTNNLISAFDRIKITLTGNKLFPFTPYDYAPFTSIADINKFIATEAKKHNASLVFTGRQLNTVHPFYFREVPLAANDSLLTQNVKHLNLVRIDDFEQIGQPGNFPGFYRQVIQGNTICSRGEYMRLTNNYQFSCSPQSAATKKYELFQPGFLGVWNSPAPIISKGGDSGATVYICKPGNPQDNCRVLGTIVAAPKLQIGDEAISSTLIPDFWNTWNAYIPEQLQQPQGDNTLP